MFLRYLIRSNDPIVVKFHPYFLAAYHVVTCEMVSLRNRKKQDFAKKLFIDDLVRLRLAPSVRSLCFCPHYPFNYL